MLIRLVVTTVLTIGVTFAQGGMSGGGMGDSGGMGGGGQRNSRGGDMSGGDMGGSRMGSGGVHRATKADQISSVLKLNGDQKDWLEAVFGAAREEAAGVARQLLESRAAIATAMMDGKSQADIDALLKAYSAQESDMVNIEVKAFTKVCTKLKPNQTSKEGPAFELMAGIFDSVGPQGGKGRDRSR
jgi:hypothetical protein